MCARAIFILAVVTILIRPATEWAGNVSTPVDDLLNEGQQWARENLSDEALSVLDNVDVELIRHFFNDLEQEYRGDTVLDIARLQPKAVAALPLLEAHAETRPYAAWLSTRLDYFRVAKELGAFLPPPRHEPGLTLPRFNPLPEQERRAWQKELEKRPAPQGAEAMAAHLKPIFVTERVPAALVWVAEVESSFNPAARSPTGAMGLYQLTPATAKTLGFSLWPRDQRLDPDKNARGAARYMKMLQKRFHDWPLAMAAYNAGETRVQALLDKHSEGTYDSIAVHLPAETQMYVPKVNATLLRREGISLHALPVPQ